MCSGVDLSAQATDQDWSFRTVESADLLFHGLAIVDFQGFSSLPLYNRRYADRVRAAKEEMGVYPTALDRQSRMFRAAFESDSTFELLHFLPLYFGFVDPTTVIQVLSEVASGRGTRSADEGAAFASSVVASVLRNRDQKRVLGEFANALEEEWNVFLRDYLSESLAERNAALSQASQDWNRRVAPAIAGFLDTRQITGGTVLVSDALGPEGRVFSGNPASSADNVFAVSLAQNDRGLGIAALLVKELCYPVASGVVEALGRSRDRVEAERLSGRLSVRCGAELLENAPNRMADEYRSTFLAAATASGIPGSTFDAAFTVEASALARLRQELFENER